MQKKPELLALSRERIPTASKSFLFDKKERPEFKYITKRKVNKNKQKPPLDF